MRRVVGGDGVDGAVAQAGDQRLLVGGQAHGRVDLGVGVVGGAQVVGAGQVMGRGLGGDLHAALLGLADQLHASLGGDVADVDGQVQRLGQHDVAGDLHLLGGAGGAAQAQQRGVVALVHHALVDQVDVLAVVEHRHAKRGAVLHRKAHQQRVHHGLAVVGDGDRAGLGHVADLGHVLALEALGHRADGVDVHAAALGLGLIDDEGGDHGVVVDGGGVGHAAHRGKAAGRRGARAAYDVLLVLLTGVAQVAVQVHHAGHHIQPLGVHNLSVLALDVLLDAADHAVLHEHIGSAVLRQGASLNKQLHIVTRPFWSAGRAAPCARPRRWSPAR